MSENEQETRLLSALAELLKDYDDYGAAKLRTDGDITIPLDPELKRKHPAVANSRMRSVK